MYKWTSISIIVVLVAGLTASLSLYFQESSNLKDAKSEIDTLESNISSLNEDLSLAETEVLTLESSLNDAEADISDLEVNLVEKEAEVSTLEADLAVVVAEISNLELELANAETNISDLEADLADKEAEVSIIEADLTAAEADISNLELELANTEAEVSSLETDLAAATARVSELEAQIWTNQFGTTAADFVYNIFTNTQGIFVVGGTYGTFQGQTSTGDQDAFVCWYDTLGNLIWAHQFGTSESEWLYAVAADSSGIYVSGITSGIFPGKNNAGGQDAFVRKYDLNGNALWTDEFGAQYADVANGIAVNDGSIYVSGDVSGALPGQSSYGGQDSYLRKYDSNGNIIWTRQFGLGQYADVANGVAVDSTGVYITGWYWDKNQKASNIYVRKYDHNGVIVWTQNCGTSMDDFPETISLDSSGIYISGYTFGTFSGQTTNGGTDAFIIKYDTLGNQLWTRQFGTNAEDGANTVSADLSGIYVAGYTLGTFSGQSSMGNEDVFVRKYDTAGNEVWTKQFGTSGRDKAMGISVDSSIVYVTGYVGGSLFGQPALGSFDIFLIKRLTSL